MPAHFVGRPTTGAGDRSRAHKVRPRQRRTLDGALQSAGYNREANDRPIDFAHLKQAVSLEMILSRYGYLSQLKRVGTQLAGPCPIHAGSGREFIVHLASNNWHCFGACNQGGGALDFVAMRERVPIARAGQLIAEWFALAPSPSSGTVRRQQRRKVMATSSKPSHRVYVVENREDAEPSSEQSGYWTRIGAAWPHADGKGLNVLLSALPIGNRIVLREYTEEDAKADEARRKPAKK